MCGFVGFIGYDPISEKKFNSTKAGSDLIRHRGPDAFGSIKINNLALVFRRLSILDRQERSNQPFRKIGNRYIVCFNGEIYNYKELRSKLSDLGIVFQTCSDTEVLYEAYCMWGKKALKMLKGMFAVAIYDCENQSILLARDPMGIKPLYYKFTDDGLYFASENKALNLDEIQEVNVPQIFEHLSYGDVYSEDTIYRAQKKLIPGQILEFIDGKINKELFFDLKQTFQKKLNKPVIPEIHKVLNKVVVQHMQCDVKYGLQLSGGLDSSLLCAIAAENTDKALEAFSINFHIPEIDEGPYQRYVADCLGIKHHPIIYTEQDFFDLEELEAAIYNYDGPLHHPNILASDKLNKYAAANGIKVLLSGDGADEVFGGYSWNQTSPGNLIDVIKESEFISSDTLQNLLANKSSQTLYTSVFSDCEKKPCKSVLSSFIGQRYYVQKWLQRQDRSGMRNSVEIRVPFLDVRVVEALNNYHISFLSSAGTQPKHVLKQIAEEYFLPEFIYRKKLGFPLPLEDWFRAKNNIYLDILRNLKHASVYMDQNAVNNIINEHLLGVNHGRYLWSILNLEIWLKQISQSE